MDDRNVKAKRHFESLMVGDEVGLSAGFLHAVCGMADLASMRGKVVAKDTTVPFVIVDWGDGDNKRVAASCVAKVGTVAFSDPHHLG